MRGEAGEVGEGDVGEGDVGEGEVGGGSGEGGREMCICDTTACWIQGLW